MASLLWKTWVGWCCWLLWWTFQRLCSWRKPQRFKAVWPKGSKLWLFDLVLRERTASKHWKFLYLRIRLGWCSHHLFLCSTILAVLIWHFDKRSPSLQLDSTCCKQITIKNWNVLWIAQRMSFCLSIFNNSSQVHLSWLKKDRSSVVLFDVAQISFCWHKLGL